MAKRNSNSNAQSPDGLLWQCYGHLVLVKRRSAGDHQRNRTWEETEA